MNLKVLIITYFVLCLIHLSLSKPVENFTVAYNLHQNLSIHDINNFGNDTRIKALLDVQTTIDEVEKLLVADPSLPRLTKGEIRDLFEKVTKDELKKSISNGDSEKQEFMKNLILALPYHSDEIVKIEELASLKASTMHPIVEPIIPVELKVLLKKHGLLNDDKKIGLEVLPVLPSNDYPLPGFLRNHTRIDSSEKSNVPKIKPESFLSFKQIAVNNKNLSSDVEFFLNKFGFFDNNNTESMNVRLIKKEKHTSSVVKPAYLTSEFSDVLKDMGLKSPKFDALTSSKGSTPDPIKESSKKGVQSKNSFKRQDSNDYPTKINFGLNDKPLLESSLEATDETTSKTLETSTAQEITTSTESLSINEEKKNNLEDEIDPIDEPEQLPGPRRSGFYMIFDWNTFLEVGEDPEKIVVRFDPKIGDPSRFLPVTVP